MIIQPYLEKMIIHNASDLHLQSDSPPAIRSAAGVLQLNDSPIPEKTLIAILREILDKDRIDQLFRDKTDVDFAYQDPKCGRFRINAYYQRDKISMAIRSLPKTIPSFEELDLPPVLKKMAMMPRGLVLVTGSAGSGKTTTQAAMIDYINDRLNYHIVTLEDPIEIIHENKRSVIEQREIGRDIPTFGLGLKYALRQDPDIVLIGEMRDLETIEAAVQLSNSGTLVIGTLHTIGIPETISRVIDMFPPEQQQQCRLSLAHALQCIISQRLATSSITKKKVLITETMINSKLFKECIVRSKEHEIRKYIIQESEAQGMHTFDQSLIAKFVAKKLNLEDIERLAVSPHDIQVEIGKLGLLYDTK